MNKKDKITFSFGENWSDFLDTVDKKEIYYAKRDIVKVFNHVKEKNNARFNFKEKSVLDIGCGSGLHSYAFYLLGAKSIYSFDYDMKSVETTKRLWEKAGRPSNWSVTHGSILDKRFIATIPKSDIVYAWGCLHHTGAVWRAIDNTIALLNGSGSHLFLSLYQDAKTTSSAYESRIFLSPCSEYRKRYSASAYPQAWSPCCSMPGR